MAPKPGTQKKGGETAQNARSAAAAKRVKNAKMARMARATGASAGEGAAAAAPQTSMSDDQRISNIEERFSKLKADIELRTNFISKAQVGRDTRTGLEKVIANLKNLQGEVNGLLSTIESKIETVVGTIAEMKDKRAKKEQIDPKRIEREALKTQRERLDQLQRRLTENIRRCQNRMEEISGDESIQEEITKVQNDVNKYNDLIGDEYLMLNDPRSYINAIRSVGNQIADLENRAGPERIASLRTSYTALIEKMEGLILSEEFVGTIDSMMKDITDIQTGIKLEIGSVIESIHNINGNKKDVSKLEMINATIMGMQSRLEDLERMYPTKGAGSPSYPAEIDQKIAYIEERMGLLKKLVDEINGIVKKIGDPNDHIEMMERCIQELNGIIDDFNELNKKLDSSKKKSVDPTLSPANILAANEAAKKVVKSMCKMIDQLVGEIVNKFLGICKKYAKYASPVPKEPLQRIKYPLPNHPHRTEIEDLIKKINSMIQEMIGEKGTLIKKCKDALSPNTLEELEAKLNAIFMMAASENFSKLASGNNLIGDLLRKLEALMKQTNNVAKKPFTFKPPKGRGEREIRRRNNDNNNNGGPPRNNGREMRGHRPRRVNGEPLGVGEEVNEEPEEGAAEEVGPEEVAPEEAPGVAPRATESTSAQRDGPLPVEPLPEERVHNENVGGLRNSGVRVGTGQAPVAPTRGEEEAVENLRNLELRALEDEIEAQQGLDQRGTVVRPVGQINAMTTGGETVTQTQAMEEVPREQHINDLQRRAEELRRQINRGQDDEIRQEAIRSVMNQNDRDIATILVPTQKMSEAERKRGILTMVTSAVKETLMKRITDRREVQKAIDAAVTEYRSIDHLRVAVDRFYNRTQSIDSSNNGEKSTSSKLLDINEKFRLITNGLIHCVSVVSGRKEPNIVPDHIRDMLGYGRGNLTYAEVNFGKQAGDILDYIRGQLGYSEDRDLYAAHLEKMNDIFKTYLQMYVVLITVVKENMKPLKSLNSFDGHSFYNMFRSALISFESIAVDLRSTIQWFDDQIMLVNQTGKTSIETILEQMIDAAKTKRGIANFRDHMRNSGSLVDITTMLRQMVTLIIPLTKGAPMMKYKHIINSYVNLYDVIYIPKKKHLIRSKYTMYKAAVNEAMKKVATKKKQKELAEAIRAGIVTNNNAIREQKSKVLKNVEGMQVPIAYNMNRQVAMTRGKTPKEVKAAQKRLKKTPKPVVIPNNQMSINQVEAVLKELNSRTNITGRQRIAYLNKMIGKYKGKLGASKSQIALITKLENRLRNEERALLSNGTPGKVTRNETEKERENRRAFTVIMRQFKNLTPNKRANEVNKIITRLTRERDAIPKTTPEKRTKRGQLLKLITQLKEYGSTHTQGEPLPQTPSKLTYRSTNRNRNNAIQQKKKENEKRKKHQNLLRARKSKRIEAEKAHKEKRSSTK